MTDHDPTAQLQARLTDALGEDAVVSDAEALAAHSADLLDAGATGALLVSPASVEALMHAVRIIGEAGFAMVPRGGGLTYVAGYTPAHAGFVTVDLRRLDRIVEISERDMFITVEAGVTWKQIHEAIQPLGLRLPFFGTFSGRAATVGGGLSNGALFLGTARYGSAAEIVLGMDVVLADGSLLATGQLAVAKASKPIYRSFGPDTTGLFVHDAGAFGIKARASLRLIRQPAFSDYLSFGFAERRQAVEALSEIGRSELAEDAYLMDPDKTRLALAPSSLVQDASTLFKVIGKEASLLQGLKAGAKLAIAGRDFIEAGCYALHLVCAGRSAAAVKDDMAQARAIAAKLNGRELPDSVPRATRADLFAPLDTVVGPTGDRWVAVNAKVAHSDAPAMIEEVEALIASHKAVLDRHGVVTSRLFTVISNHAFSYEPVFNWHDAWLPLHHATLSAAAKGRIKEPQPNPEARALVMDLREQIVAVFARHGAASTQIGRTYPYASVLREEPRALLQDIKHLLDPHGRLNPGVLELGGNQYDGGWNAG